MRNGAVRKMRFSVVLFCLFICLHCVLCLLVLVCEREDFYKSLFVDCQKTSASSVFFYFCVCAPLYVHIVLKFSVVFH